MNNFLKRPTLFCCLLLSFCITPKAIAQQIHAEHKHKTNKAFTKPVPSAWELSGVMAARNYKKSWSAQINWLQPSSHVYQIRLMGPLGSGAILIERNGRIVVFREGQKSHIAKDADELLQQKTGVRLPVANLYYWVRGIPAPGSVGAAKHDAAGQLLLLKQAGFTIEYPEYVAVGNAVLPKIIRLSGHGIFVKLVIKRWKGLSSHA